MSCSLRLCVVLVLVTVWSTSCGERARGTRLTFSGSALGPEAELVQRQLVRFGERHPGVEVELRVTPDAADQRHQLYVQWLNARAPDPDVLQLDIIWTAVWVPETLACQFRKFWPVDVKPQVTWRRPVRGVSYASMVRQA